MAKDADIEKIAAEIGSLGELLRTLLNGSGKVKIEMTCELVRDDVPETPPRLQRPFDTEGRLKGLSELAAFLGCSRSAAQKYKLNGTIPFYENGRSLYFYEDEVRDAVKDMLGKYVFRGLREGARTVNKNDIKKGATNGKDS